MLAFLAGVIRIMVGFCFACLAGGAVTVMFAVTPAELIDASAPNWEAVGGWTLYTATITAGFAFPLAVLAIVGGEWRGIRSLAYYGVAGIIIALIGLMYIAMNESAAMPSVINAYAAAAFLTAGLVSGFIYWLFSGRFARQTNNDGMPEGDNVSQPSPPRAPASPAQAVSNFDDRYKA